MNISSPKETQEKIPYTGIRQAMLDDACAIAQINYNGWNENFRGVIDDVFLDTLNLQKRQERIINTMKHDDGSSIYLVYELDGKVVGFIHGGKKRDENIPHEAEIYALYVDPKTQGKGIGKTLMNALLETSHFKDKQSFYLRTLKNKAETRGFYERMGGKVFTEKEHEIGGKKYPMVGYYRQK